MEPSFDTSFIPKRPMFKEEAGMRRHEPISVVLLIGFAVFFAALALTGLAFFFDRKETASVRDLGAQLALEKDKFNPQAIEELRGVAKRLSYAKGVLDNHVAISPLLDLVQSVTLKSVYYESFMLVHDKEKGYKLALSGRAPTYGLVYAQIDALRNEPKIRELAVLNTSLEELTGGATFQVMLHLSPEVLKYVPPTLPEPIPPVADAEPLEDAPPADAAP